MAEIVSYWAGKERLFRLNVGLVLDLQEALGRQPVGTTYMRLATGQFAVQDIVETLRQGLIGGGESVVDAKRLIDTHFDSIGYAESAGIAGDLLAALMDGVEPGGEKGDKPDEPIRFSELAQICRVFNMSPGDLRAMRYADLVNMLRGYNASQPDRPIEHLSEEEFLDILNRYEPKE